MASVDRGSRRNGLASPARFMVREDRDYTLIVRLFVMHNYRSQILTNKISCRNNLTPRDFKNFRFGLLSVRPCKKNYLFIIRKKFFNGEGGHFLFLFCIFKKNWFFHFLLRLFIQDRIPTIQNPELKSPKT